jgi:ABC-type glycerol-3-phosphate transport system permease component
MAKRYKIHAKNYGFIICIAAVLVLNTLVLGTMIYLALTTSLKEYFDFKINPIMGLPEKLWFQNYVDAFSAFAVKVDGNTRTVMLFEMLVNSVIHAIGCSLTATITPCLVAYLVAKYDEKLNDFVYYTVIVAMILPIVGALPSEIQIAKQLGLYNTRFGMVLMRASYLGTYFLIFHGTFKGLSDEYIEAATIDGAGQWQVMIQIVFPLIKTTIFAIFLLNFISYWNEYQGPLIYMGDYPTAAVGLFRYVYNASQSGASAMTLQMAGCMILFVPILVLFLIFKDVFMGNLTVGGIKG